MFIALLKQNLLHMFLALLKQNFDCDILKLTVLGFGSSNLEMSCFSPSVNHSGNAYSALNICTSNTKSSYFSSLTWSMDIEQHLDVSIPFYTILSG